MRATHLGFIFASALSPLACASHPPPIEAVPTNQAQPALPPLPRSSIAAVVLHRVELGLTDEQVGEMEQRDQQREAENGAVRAEMENQSQKGPSAPSSSGGAGSNGAGGGTAAQGMGGGMRGGGMHGGGMHGGRMGGRSSASGLGNGKAADRAAKLEDRFDDNDTKAYLDAEGVLTEAQKARAREIASDYREQLYAQRESARSAHAK